MSNKDNKTIKVSEFRQGFKTRFEEISPKLERRDRMKIAVELDIALETVNRYIDGKLEDIRRLELAESILATAKEVLRLKNTPTPATA